MDKTVTLKPFDSAIADVVYSCLFCHTGKETEQGLEMIPAASYQLTVSALEAIMWETHGQDRETIRQAIGIVACLRDKQKHREYIARKQEQEAN